MITLVDMDNFDYTLQLLQEGTNRIKARRAKKLGRLLKRRRRETYEQTVGALEDVIDGKVRCHMCMDLYDVAALSSPQYRKVGVLPTCKECRYKNDIMKKFGITLAECEALMQSRTVCDICGKYDTVRLCIDHDHKTGRIRGLLCQTCNRALGGFKDDPILLGKALAYLQAHE